MDVHDDAANLPEAAPAQGSGPGERGLGDGYLGTVRVEIVRKVPGATGCAGESVALAGGETGADAGGAVTGVDAGAEGAGDARIDTFEVPYREHTTVLDALTWIKDNVDPTLTFRWSCRMAICGSCGVMVNGRPVLGCETFARGFKTSGLNIAPLEHFEVLRDLVVDTDGFLGKLGSVKPWLIGADQPTDSPSPPGRVVDGDAAASEMPGTGSGRQEVRIEARQTSGSESARPQLRPTAEASTNTQTPAQLAAFHDFAQCIDCMLCYAACPQLDVVPGFVGPAAVATARRWDVDSRDTGEMARANVLDVEEGVWPCIQIGACTQVCPRGVDPARALRDAQRVATETWEQRQG